MIRIKKEREEFSALLSLNSCRSFFDFYDIDSRFDQNVYKFVA